MGKDVPQNQPVSSTKVVDKVMKQKNRFRSGLGFRGDQARSDAQNDKVRIAQAVSKKKILEGTRADKTQEDNQEFITRDLEIDEEVTGARNVWKGNQKTHKGKPEAQEEELSSSRVTKTKYVDPRKQQPWASS